MKKLIIVLTFILIPLTKVQAEVPLFGEVSLGYENSKIAATNLIGPNENASTTGFNVSARAGYAYSIFLLGVEAQGSAGSLIYDLPQIKNGYWNKTFTYLFAGFDFGMFRIWGNYGVMNQMRLALDYGTYITDKIYSGGTSYKVGASVALSKRIHIKAEYFSNTPNQMQNSTGNINYSAVYSKWTETGYVFSVSYNLFGSEIKSK